MTDPLDKQLVEVALSGGGRRKADIEEAKLAGVRTRRALDEDSLEDDEDRLLSRCKCRSRDTPGPSHLGV